MKIGIVTAHYMPEVGYQEVHLPRAFARNGYTVRVFTTNASVHLGGTMNKLSYQPGLFVDEKYGFDILRLPALTYKSKVIGWGLKKSVLDFKPDVLIILGVAKVFPYSLLNQEIHRHIKMVSVYGDAHEYLDRITWKQKVNTFLHELGFRIIKYPLYRRALHHGDRLVMNIPETQTFFLNFLKGKDIPLFETKKKMLTLGFDPDAYYFTPADREMKRKELGFEDQEIVFITSTRINKRKNLERNISLVSRLHAQGKKVAYVLVGFLGDRYESELKEFIAKQENPGLFSCFSFLPDKEIRKLYCAADVGIWLKAAISIQEAMGTGLPIVLENKASVNHLLKEGINGWFFEPDSFEKVIEEVVDHLARRGCNRTALVSDNAQNLSYDYLAKKMIENLLN